MSPRHTDTTPGWIKRRFAKIEKWQREQSAARRMESATIGRGGLTIKNRGTLRSKYATGADAVIIGPVYPDAHDEGAQIALLDEAEQVIFNAYRLPPTTDNPTPTSAVYAQGTFVFLLSQDNASQLYISDDLISLTGGPNGVCITHSTTGASANCFIDPSDGRIWRSTSSRRYKQDIEDVDVDAAAVLNMQGRTWRDKGEVANDADTERRYVGFIAEELHDLGLGQFVVYDAEDKPEAIAYDRLSVALLAVVKDVNTRLTELEASVNEAPAKS